ncbi:MAG: TolC family protein [Defluviitaleaceae bacterium]|nr:TolC family protein [Defluviitaleaceae bacterium]
MRKYIFLLVALFVLPFTNTYVQEHVTFTYEQALDMALRDLLFIIDTDIQLEELQEQRDDLDYELRRMRNWASSRALDEKRREIAEVDRQMLNLTLQQQQTKLLRESALRNAMVALNASKFSVYVMEASLTLAEQDLNRANARYRHGLISTNDLRTAQNTFAQAQADMHELILDHNTAMQSINHILGQPLHQLTQVEVTDDTTSYDTRNIASIITSAPTIRQYQINVDRKHEERRAYEGDDRYVIAELRAAYERAALERDQAKTAMEVSIRRVLNEQQNLIQQHDSLLTELNDAYIAAKNTQTNLDLGRATLHDLEQAQLNILRARQRLNTNANSQWVQIFLLQNPSLLP